MVKTPVSAIVASPDITLSIHVEVPVSYNNNEASAAEVILVSFISANVSSVAITVSTYALILCCVANLVAELDDMLSSSAMVKPSNWLSSPVVKVQPSSIFNSALLAVIPDNSKVVTSGLPVLELNCSNLPKRAALAGMVISVVPEIPSVTGAFRFLLFSSDNCCANITRESKSVLSADAVSEPEVTKSVVLAKALDPTKVTVSLPDAALPSVTLPVPVVADKVTE